MPHFSSRLRPKMSRAGPVDYLSSLAYFFVSYSPRFSSSHGLSSSSLPHSLSSSSLSSPLSCLFLSPHRLAVLVEIDPCH